jgi:hypothetical protein
MTLEPKRVIYSMYTMLSFLLLVRHSQFYLFKNINTEYGFDQPFWGILLIPITASFGASFCIGRRILIEFSLKDYARVLLVGLIPIFLAVFYGFNAQEFFEYSIYSTASRPPFLILLSISICILVFDSINKIFLRADLYMILLCLVLINSVESFILYYSAVMLSAAYIINLICTRIIQYIFISLYLVIFVVIEIFHITRLFGIGELLFVIGFLMLIRILAQASIIPAIKFSMLDFYILQAILFTLVIQFNSHGFMLVVVSSFSYGLLFIMGRLSFIGRSQ